MEVLLTGMPVLGGGEIRIAFIYDLETGVVGYMLANDEEVEILIGAPTT